MSDFFELFNPGLRHLREQRDLEKVLVVEPRKGGRGPQPLDLESGRVTIVMPSAPVQAEAQAEPPEDPGASDS